MRTFLFALTLTASHAAFAGCDDDGDEHDSILCGGDDCDDDDPNRFPGNLEVCDGANHDEDCNLLTFGNQDEDGDGRFDATCCNEFSGGTLHCGTDCDDAEASTYPGASEVCNSRDDNCDGAIDEGLLVVLYLDEDGDGFGRLRANPTCPQDVGSNAIRSGDCDDANPAVHPGVQVCTDDFTVQVCGADGEFEPVLCPEESVCFDQPNGTGICTPQKSKGKGQGGGGRP